MRTREDHLVWCKLRALGYVEQGDLNNAIVSMASDLGKHEETRKSVDLIVLGMNITSKDKMKEFIEGFN